ncbi:hypothetical protein OV208_34730 [Corallococcus sp. bb12-1]|uniref:hypothetical protein n=1 Tax=Corallococcus sp. bb12-1 TaxID=2996784 RepID=UPI002270BD3E|nr:hypothetical protein [Corallococcus sp. bb12-1]MCY1046513.1 hypothetical protein [Corallococcus sp. bb12-1]
MFEANCLQESPGHIVARVLAERKPCLVSARSGERGVLIPHEERYLPVLNSHPRVIDAWVKDLKRPGTDMAMYCLQLALTEEQDAFRYLDERERPILAMVGVNRFRRWEKRQAAPAKKAVAKKAPGKKAAAKKAPAKKAANARRVTSRS